MFERFTDRARMIMALANQEAQRFNHEYIDSEHILLGLVKEGSGVGANVLKQLNIDLRKARLDVEKLLKSGPEMATMGMLPQTGGAKKVIEYAITESRDLNHNYVGSEHLLLGLLREHNGIAARVLTQLGVTLEAARKQVIEFVGIQRTEASSPPPRPEVERAEPLDFTIRTMLDRHDPQLRELEAQKHDAIRHANYDRAAAVRDAAMNLISTKSTVLREIIERDFVVAQTLQAALSRFKPHEIIDTPRLLVALINSDPALAARLAPLLPEIEKACHADPPVPNAEPKQ